MGDGVLVYFGYPRAHEDDAERAVRAGLEIAAAVRSLETRGTERLAVRIGIATGLVVAAAAEQSLQTAVAVAQSQKARSFELRAALSLAKLYRAANRDADA